LATFNQPVVDGELLARCDVTDCNVNSMAVQGEVGSKVRLIAVTDCAGVIAAKDIAIQPPVDVVLV